MEMFDFTAEEKEVLEKLPIEALVLFGSRATKTARNTSDYDFGAVLSSTLSGGERKEVYAVLYDVLSGKIRQLVNIDIVFLLGASAELQASVAKNGVVLYEKTPFAFARFRERAMEMYADLAPIRRIFEQAILARIP
jgi:predicted nucleotidyltransferase